MVKAYKVVDLDGQNLSKKDYGILLMKLSQEASLLSENEKIEIGGGIKILATKVYHYNPGEGAIILEEGAKNRVQGIFKNNLGAKLV